LLVAVALKMLVTALNLSIMMQTAVKTESLVEAVKRELLAMAEQTVTVVLDLEVTVVLVEVTLLMPRT
jgi:hypothetical protein